MDGTHVRLDTFPRSSWGPGRYSVTVGASFRLRPRKPLAAAELAESHVIPLQDLVSWATQQPASVTAAYLRGTLDSEPLQWLRAWRRSSVQAEEGSRGNIRFYPSDFSPHFGIGLQRWMAVRKRCSESLALLVSLIYAAPRYTDTALLLTAQALEAYHRASFPNRRWSDREFKLRRDAVLHRLAGDQDGDLQKWVADLLRFANEPSLNERLQALEKKAQAVLHDLFERRPDWDVQLKDMRNKFTHRGRRPPAYGADELFQVARFARLVLDVCLILDLGIPAETCRARVEQWSDFSWAMSEAARASSKTKRQRPKSAAKD
jgi:ApeA N-terminal domain 1